MHILDLPLHLILAGLLFRRMTQPVLVHPKASMTTPDLQFERTRDILLEIMERRKPLNGLAYWASDILERHIQREYAALQTLHELNVTIMATGYFKKGDTNEHSD